MKGNTLVLLILLFACVSSCEEEGVVKHPPPLMVLGPLHGASQLTFPESLAEWTKLRSLHGNSYAYHAEYTSFTGQHSITELLVENGIIISRVYQEFQIAEDGTREIVGAYREDADRLGSHNKGALLLTVDELYERCIGDYLSVDSESNVIHFETAETGLIKVCGFVPKDCQDDCFTGVSITAFGWLE